VTLTARSIANLIGVHPDLVSVVMDAARSARFIVTEGMRSRERQAMLYAAGKSRTMNSRHIYGMAVDLAVLLEDGGVSWFRDDYKLLAMSVKATAAEISVPIVWGGDWTTFVDCPHFELDRRFYPDPVPNLQPDGEVSKV
jgi:peptidoglycan L-alanyl-D-glutamate endopeptidase CwlK